MATIYKEIFTHAGPEAAWDAIRDVGALHTRLVPGFVVDTKLEPGARLVTFGNGMTVREPIISLDESRRRLAWSAEGGRARHYNASAQVFSEPDGTSRIVWMADLLPDEIAPAIEGMMEAGSQVMKQTLDKVAN
jgi:hypothetical protein